MKSISIVFILMGIILSTYTACGVTPGNNGNSGGSSSSSSSSTPSGIQHPAIWKDTFLYSLDSFKKSTGNPVNNIILIYMGSGCNLQSYAIQNINQTFVADSLNYSQNVWDYNYYNGWNTKIFIYIDASVDYNVFPAWVKPGGLFTINYNNSNNNNTASAAGIERFDRVYMPPDPDACNPVTLSNVLNYLKTNYNYPGSSITLIMWGHGDGIWPLNGGISFKKKSKIDIDYEEIALGILSIPLGGMFTSCSIQPGQESAYYTGNIGKPRNFNPYSSLKKFGSVLFNDNTGMTLFDSQINKAISTIFGQVGKLGFDTCYSGNLEDIYAYYNVTPFLIGSPGPEANQGWNYSNYLNGAQDAASATQVNVNLIQCDMGNYQQNIPSSMPNTIKGFYNTFTSIPSDIAFYITNMRKYIQPSNDPAAHYVRLYDILNDLQKFDPTLAGLFSQYLSDAKTTIWQETATNMGVWVPLFPKQYYNSFVKTWHNASNIQLFKDYPQVADMFTNAAWGQTQNSVYHFTPQLVQGNFSAYYLWSALSIESGDTAIVTGGYKACIIDQSSEDQTPATSISLSSSIIVRTNVAFIAGEGQADYYKITVTSSGYIRLRLTFCTPVAGNPPVSNVQLLDGSQNVLQNFDQAGGAFRSASSGDSSALSTVQYSGEGSISVSSTTNEYNNMAFIEINTNLAAGTYYIKVSAQDLMNSYYGPADAPYLIYPLPLGNGENAAAVQ